jgi:cell division protein FtsB
MSQLTLSALALAAMACFAVLAWLLSDLIAAVRCLSTELRDTGRDSPSDQFTSNQYLPAPMVLSSLRADLQALSERCSHQEQQIQRQLSALSQALTERPPAAPRKHRRAKQTSLPLDTPQP